VLRGPRPPAPPAVAVRATLPLREGLADTE
jgi:hypothetical protein